MRPEPNLDRYRFEVGRADALFRPALADDGTSNGLRVVFDSVTEVATLFYPVAPTTTGERRPVPAGLVTEAAAAALAEYPEARTAELNVPAAYVGALGTGNYDLVQSIPAAGSLSDESRWGLANLFLKKARCLARTLEPMVAGVDSPTLAAEPGADSFPDIS